MITVHIKHGTTNHEVQVPADATLQQLSEQVERTTNVFVRQQKLIFKGKVLDANKRLKNQGIGEGAKLMMLAQPGANVSAVTKAHLVLIADKHMSPFIRTRKGLTGITCCQGQQAASTTAQHKADEAKARLEAAFATARGQPIPTSLSSTTKAGPGGLAVGSGSSSVTVTHITDRQRSWRAMGVISLRELNLPALPHMLLAALPTPATSSSGAAPGEGVAQGGEEDAAWGAWAAVARGVDVCQNRLTTLPTALSHLTGLTSLKASNNQLEDIPWTSLPVSLNLLTLDHNRLSKVPDGVLGRLFQLRVLCLSYNHLSIIPEDIGHMSELQVLDVTNNKLEALPQELGDCPRLTEVCAADNAITIIPQSLARCTMLQILRLDKNRIARVPSSVLQGATSLWLLSVAANPISLDTLRETDGYKDLDERRKNRADKQIDSRVLLQGSSAFAEGADIQNWQHWQ